MRGLQHGCSYVNHASGAPGADLEWQRVGALYQVTTRAYRPFDNPAPENPCSVILSKGQLREADVWLRLAAERMHVDLEEGCCDSLNYLRKNYFQAAHADAIFAVARVIRAGAASSSKPAETLAGGTAWAFHIAILMGKNVFVFDDEEGCVDCTRMWYQWDSSTERLVPYPGTPVLTPDFAGIGTRCLSAHGAAAILKVYRKTFQGPTAASK